MESRYHCVLVTAQAEELLLIDCGWGMEHDLCTCNSDRNVNNPQGYLIFSVFFKHKLTLIKKYLNWKSSQSGACWTSTGTSWTFLFNIQVPNFSVTSYFVPDQGGSDLKHCKQSQRGVVSSHRLVFKGIPLQLTWSAHEFPCQQGGERLVKVTASGKTFCSGQQFH